MNKVTPIIRLAGPVSAILTAAFGGFLPQYWLLGVALWMLIWWITETVHLGVTALLPLVLFPALEIAGAKSLAAYYAHPLVYLFFGGFVLALALEKTGLHYRIALWILLKTGTKDHQLLAGFMLATAFMSMWISNTATAIMMLPIATSVVAVLEPQQREKLSRPILLSVAWAANIGGMATLIGTPAKYDFRGFHERTIKQTNWLCRMAPYWAFRQYSSWFGCLRNSQTGIGKIGPFPRRGKANTGLVARGMGTIGCIIIRATPCCCNIHAHRRVMDYSSVFR